MISLPGVRQIVHHIIGIWPLCLSVEAFQALSLFTWVSSDSPGHLTVVSHDGKLTKTTLCYFLGHYHLAIPSARWSVSIYPLKLKYYRALFITQQPEKCITGTLLMPKKYWIRSPGFCIFSVLVIFFILSLTAIKAAVNYWVSRCFFVSSVFRWATVLLFWIPYIYYMARTLHNKIKIYICCSASAISQDFYL